MVQPFAPAANNFGQLMALRGRMAAPGLLRPPMQRSGGLFAQVDSWSSGSNDGTQTLAESGY